MHIVSTTKYVYLAFLYIRSMVDETMVGREYDVGPLMVLDLCSTYGLSSIALVPSSVCFGSSRKYLGPSNIVLWKFRTIALTSSILLYKSGEFELAGGKMLLRIIVLHGEKIYCRVQFVSLSLEERKVIVSAINFIVSPRENVFSMTICFMVSRG